VDRLEYAHANRQRYLGWAGAVAASPLTATARLEFAAISAHTPMRQAIAGWQAVQGIEGVSDMAEALNAAGVIAPGKKAGYIAEYRRLQPMPSYPYREYRRDMKLPGLGYCKLSFACCLIDPFNSDVVCLDTHILQVYMGRRPGELDIRKCYTCLAHYEYIEGQVLAEAAQVGLPPFCFQWAVWDWKRARVDLKPPLNHSFLWRGGTTTYQLPLFSGLAT